MIDTHCHFDMMQNPEKYISEMERIGSVTIGMTNLPSHFQMGLRHIRKYKYIRLALGFHPLLAVDSQSELALFSRLIDKTSYIGEIGLDFSRAGVKSKDVQIKSLRYLLSCLQNRNKLVSVHSRGAEDVLLELLDEYDIKNVIFHWYSGKVSLIPEIISHGYYFSINEFMTLSENGRGIIAALPKERILTETDAPYNEKCNIKNVESYLAKQYGCGVNDVDVQIKSNFNKFIESGL